MAQAELHVAGFFRHPPLVGAAGRIGEMFTPYGQGSHPGPALWFALLPAYLAHRSLVVRDRTGDDVAPVGLHRRHGARRAEAVRGDRRARRRVVRRSARVCARSCAVHRTVEPLGRPVRVLLLHLAVLGSHVRASPVLACCRIRRLLRGAVPHRVRLPGRCDAGRDGRIRGVAVAPCRSRRSRRSVFPISDPSVLVDCGGRDGCNVAPARDRPAAPPAGQPAHPVAPLHSEHRSRRLAARVRGRVFGAQGVRRRVRPAWSVDPRRVPKPTRPTEPVHLPPRGGGRDGDRRRADPSPRPAPAGRADPVVRAARRFDRRRHHLDVANLRRLLRLPHPLVVDHRRLGLRSVHARPRPAVPRAVGRRVGTGVRAADGRSGHDATRSANRTRGRATPVSSAAWRPRSPRGSTTTITT